MTAIVFNTNTRTERRVRSISNLIKGDLLMVGYREWCPDHNDEFVGFKYNGSIYASMTALRATETALDLEEVRAVFVSHDNSRISEWEAYRYNGRWAVGSSADGAKLYSPVLILAKADGTTTTEAL